MNNYGVPNGTYLKSFSQKIPQLFIIHQQSDFIIHYSLRDCCILQQSFSIPKGGKEPGADDQSAPGPFRKEKRGKKMKVESNYEA